MMRLTILGVALAMALGVPACKKKQAPPPPAKPQAKPIPPAPAQPTTPAKVTTTPRQVLEQAVAAHGGAQALRQKFSSSTFTSQGVYYGTPYKLKTYWKAPDKMVMEFPDMSMTMGYVGKDCWNRMYGLVVDCSPQEKPTVREMLKIGYWAHLYPLLDSGLKLASAPDRDVAGKPAVGVTVTSKDGSFTATFHFEKKTHRLVRMAYHGHWAGGKGELVTEITAHRSMGGIVVPARSTMSFAGKRVLSETVLNAELGEVEEANLRRPKQVEFGRPMRTKVPALTVAFVTHRGSYESIGKSIGRLMGLVQEAKLTPMGAPAMVFLKPPKKGRESVTEVRLPVAPPTRKVTVPGLGMKKVPAMKVALSSEKGPYGQIGPKIGKLAAWVKKRGFLISGPAMMVGLSDPQKAPPAEHLSQIYFPIVRKK